MTSRASTQVTAAPHPKRPEEVELRELLDTLLSSRWLIAAIASVSLLLGIAYAVFARPMYEADGLMQVEPEQQGLGTAFNDVSSILSGTTASEVPAEIAVLGSRLVLKSVIANLKLAVEAEPAYFPIVGRTIASWNDDAAEPVSAWPGFRAFAWGGERIQISDLDVPPKWLDKTLKLRAKGGSAFDLFSPAGKLLASGTVGERLSVETGVGHVSLFVQVLKAQPGTGFKLRHRAIQKVLADLEKRLVVAEQPHDSGVMALSVRAYSAEASVTLLDEIENVYLRQNVERRSTQAQKSLDFLKQQLPELRENVDRAQAELNRYQLKRGTVDVQEETQLLLKRAIELETQRLKLVQDRNVAAQRFTPEHPVISALNEQISGVQREQQSLRKQIDNLPETQQEVLSLLRDVDVNTQLYTALMNSAQELQVAKAGTIGNVRVIDQAMLPLEPVTPRRMLTIVASAIGGLMLGIFSVLGMRLLQKGVDKPEQVEKATGLATYASVPYSAAQKRIGKAVGKRERGSYILAVDNVEDPAIEALRSLVTALHFAMLEADNNIVMFTGPTAALGKSFVSSNLGAVLAAGGKRVVLIDADMRRGMLHRYFGIPQTPGLSDRMAGTADDEAIMQATRVDGLTFIASGTRPPNPTEMLMSESFSKLLKDLSQRFDFVLIDTPPVLPVADAAIVGRLAGTTLVVLKAAEHPMRAIEETVRRLRHAGVAVRGTIFNQVGARVGSHGYGSYGSTYGYSSDGYGRTP